MSILKSQLFRIFGMGQITPTQHLVQNICLFSHKHFSNSNANKNHDAFSNREKGFEGNCDIKLY